MKPARFLLAAALALAPVAAAAAPTAGTRVLVLGTAHLSSLGEQLRPVMLDSLIDRLKSLQPDVVMVEALAGPGIAAMKEEGGEAGDILEDYGSRLLPAGLLAQGALGLDWGQAYRAVNAPGGRCDAPEPGRTCLLHALAAYEYDTGLLQFTRLADEERDRFADEFPEIAAAFERSLESANEYYTIALRLARELELSRIHPVDSHAEKAQLQRLVDATPGADALYEAIFGNVSEAPFLKEMERRKQEAIAGDDLLPFYRWLNSPASQQRDIDLQWTPLLARDDESGFGRSRVMLWDQRNLEMAANIAAVMAHYPGGTGVYIVGAAHKPWVDAMLSTLLTIDVLDAGAVLGGTDP